MNDNNIEPRYHVEYDVVIRNCVFTQQKGGTMETEVKTWERDFTSAEKEEAEECYKTGTALGLGAVMVDTWNLNREL